MLNRAPTLHRLGIQAFEPVLVEGRAIKLHPSYVRHTTPTLTETRWLVHVPLSGRSAGRVQIPSAFTKQPS